jgi:hypothetical protein
MMKTCSICGERKPLEEFGRRASATDGHRGDCKICRKDAGLGYAAKSNETYAQRIMAVLKKHDAPMWIDDLRAAFKSTRAEKEGISSALRSMSDRGEIYVTGGMAHRNSKKMISIVPIFHVPAGARIVRLTDTWRNDSALIPHKAGLQSCHGNLMMFCGE